MSRKTKIFLVFFSLLLTPSLIYADSINLTTYYPAPFGSYSQLQLLPQDGTGVTCTAASDSGRLYIDSTTFELKVCNGTSFTGTSPWTENQGAKTIFATDAIADPAYFVGVGVQTPLMKLHLAQDGGILAEGTFGAGKDISAAPAVTSAGTKFLWYPRKAAIRAGGINGTQWDDANIGNYSVALGYNTKASRDYATISGGSGNVNQSFNGVFGVDAQYSTVGGGLNNMMSTYGSTIGGGEGNGTLRAGVWYNGYFGPYQTIAGGYNNKVESTLATIGGGSNNLNLGGFSTIAGGDGNIVGDGVSGDFAAFIGGGSNNRVSAFYATISGGQNNTVPGLVGATFGDVIAGGIGNNVTGGPNVGGGFAVIGGGWSNTAISYSATVAGGTSNQATAGFSTVGGGSGNIASGVRSTISGGTSNTGSGFESSIGGGDTNIASGSMATISGGDTNTAGGPRDAVGGGFQNNATTPPTGPFPITEWSATIAGGSDNVVSRGFSTVGGGRANTASGIYATVPGGQNNIAAGDYSFAAGRNTQISNAGSGTFAWGNNAAASSVTIPNSFVVFPANEGSMLVGSAANAAAGGTTNGPYKLYVNGKIGGRFDGVNEGELKLQYYNDGTSNSGYYAVYAP